MRKFIPISIFKTLYSSQSELLTEEGMNAFREKFAEDGVSIAQAAGFDTEHCIAFQETLREPSNVVFYGWIEQTPPLKNALLGNKLSLFTDSAKHLEHTLSRQYKKFLSPVLSERLLSAQIESDAERKIALSFVQLLDEDHRSVVEDRLFSPIIQRLLVVKMISEKTTDEQDLVNAVTPMCSDDIIASVNYLSRASYAAKLGYVDKILDTIYSKACTVRFANWILSRMSLVNLNNEHLHKLTDLRKELKHGNLKVKNHKRGNAPIPMRGIFTALVIALLVGAVIFLIIYKPFNQIEEEPLSKTTSFKEFTVEERIRMDSLLEEMDNPFHVVDSIDPLMQPVQMGVDVDLVLRKEFDNEKMEAIYEDLMTDVHLKTNYPDSACSSSKNTVFKSTHGTKPVDFSSGLHTAVLRNESDYDIILYVAENTKDGSVFASLIKPNETIEFKINKFNTMTIVAGNDFQAFKAPAHTNKEELPSSDFTHHFCNTDLNYEETINTTYQFKHPRQGKNKFMVKGAKSGYVHLVDIHGVLDTY